MLLFSWSDLARIALVGPLTYFALIIVLRVSGKRTLSKMNAFDFVVTVAMGSTLATALVSRDLSLAGGIAALGLLVALQFLITWTSMRVKWAERLVKSEPTLLFHRGGFLDDALAAERVTRDEAIAAVRQQGLGSLDAVGAIVLETDGKLSVLPAAGLDPSVLHGVKGSRHPET
ncbi:MAG TPA: YetF domain-containing protein [Longimicrobiales bacterium]|nr:YetF domain-containing protein [Longimicrobiales bacterium]